MTDNNFDIYEYVNRLEEVQKDEDAIWRLANALLDHSVREIEERLWELSGWYEDHDTLDPRRMTEPQMKAFYEAKARISMVLASILEEAAGQQDEIFQIALNEGDVAMGDD